MSEENKSHQYIIVTPAKSVGISLILTILFGPLGMLYSTVRGGISMLILSFLVGLFTLGAGFIVTWPICIIWGAMAVSSSNKKNFAQVSMQV